MEKQVTITEAKNKLPAIVHEVEKGPSVKLTRRGRAVAVLLSIKEYQALHENRVGFWNALKAFREKNQSARFSDEDIACLRDRSIGRAVDLT